MSFAARAGVAAVVNVPDGGGIVGELGEVAAGGLDAGVAEAAGDDVDPNALGDERGRVMGAQHVRVAQALGHARDIGVAGDELVQRLVGELPGRLGAVAPERDEQRLVVAQARAAAAERMDREPGVQGRLGLFGGSAKAR